MADILLALDYDDIAFLILLYLSSAFNTIDHATLCTEISYGPGGSLLGWFQSYLSGARFTNIVVRHVIKLS